MSPPNAPNCALSVLCGIIILRGRNQSWLLGFAAVGFAAACVALLRTLLVQGAKHPRTRKSLPRLWEIGVRGWSLPSTKLCFFFLSALQRTRQKDL